MIPELITLLNSELPGRFQKVGYMPKVDPIKHHEEETPAALFIYGDRKFNKGNEHSSSHQASLSTVNIYLMAPVDDIYELEIEIIRVLMGYLHDDQHSGLDAIEAVTVDAQEGYFTRRIVLGSDNHIFKK